MFFVCLSAPLEGAASVVVDGARWLKGWVGGVRVGKKARGKAGKGKVSVGGKPVPGKTA